MIRSLRVHDRVKHPDMKASMLPYSFLALLEFMDERKEKQILRKSLYKGAAHSVDTKSDMSKYLYLFGVARHHEEDSNAEDHFRLLIEVKLQMNKMLEEIAEEKEKPSFDSRTRLNLTKSMDLSSISATRTLDQ